MTRLIPKLLEEAVSNESWKNVTPHILRRCLGNELDDLELFSSIAAMKRETANLEVGGYVDDPEFCMTREDASSPGDPRLEIQRALLIGGSVTPGDDVFIAIRLLDTDREYDPPILIFDWRAEVPCRWDERGTLRELIDRIAVEC